MITKQARCTCWKVRRGLIFKGMKIAIILLLLAVIGSLFSGLYFVGADKGETHRAVIALTVRVGLSLLVFGLLLLSWFMGWTTGGKL